MNKPRRNNAACLDEVCTRDQCQTPPYALDPLMPYLDTKKRIWEPAMGEGKICWTLDRNGFKVIGTDLMYGSDYNFFAYEPASWEVLITNPPFSQYVKYPWIKRCYELGRPFALLMQVDTVGAEKAQRLFGDYGIEILWLNPRINFKMPTKGYRGKGSTFSTAWFTWGLNVGRQNTFNVKIWPRLDESEEEIWSPLSYLPATAAAKMDSCHVSFSTVLAER